MGDGERVAVAALAGANGNGSGNGAAKLLGLLTSDQPAAGRGPRLRVGHALSRSGNLGTWTGEGPTLLSAFTGGADGADGAGDGGSPVPGPDGGEPPADGSGGQPSAASAGVQAVRNLADLDPTEERQRVGVIVVTPPMAPRVSLEQIEDLLQLSGWPLLGVVTVRPSRRFWER